MRDAGVKVLRTWVNYLVTKALVVSNIPGDIQGFNAINGSELAGARNSGLTYYQVNSRSPSYYWLTRLQGLEFYRLGT